MQIRKFRHSCLFVADGDARILIDPGVFSTGFDHLTALTAVLITHAHADHLDREALGRVLAGNPQATVYADAGSAAQLAEAGTAVTAVRPGDVLDVGTRVEVSGGEHAVIHADLPTVPNVCYLIGGRLYHPGDSLVPPERPVDVLAVPAGAPWMAVKEAVDFVRVVTPERALPIHEQVLSSTAMSYRILSSLAPQGTVWTDIDDGSVLQI
jgi:L-ascorbate metabolism protein UlaG (beta-lactamase superfamily)